jgi:hypothetical protein
MNGTPWMQASWALLRQVLSDTTDLGTGWRNVLGGAPQLAEHDTIEQVVDEQVCREIAQLINQSILGWPVGAPPVVILQVREHLIAFPSNASMGHYGLAVGMASDRRIRGVATW